MTAHQGGGCTKLEPRTPEATAQKERNCASPGYSQENIARALYEHVKAGGRMAGDHMTGDVEIDMVLDIIEKASKDAGMTLDDIRSKRHVTEHMTLYPRPDQIPRFKNLGMMTSGWDIVVWQGTVTNVLKNYGESGAMNMVPRKALYDAGVKNSVEIDRPLSEYTNLSYMHVLYSGITRTDWDGNVVAPAQAISREAMLKSATQFAAYGTLREDDLGSLEPGKFADLVVLDKDYLTIPIKDILTIKVLLTIVGGKMEHLAPSLARELGLQPVGAQIELGGPAAQW
jgi:predicted amidohydrolase YtcJ